jgi:cystathionine beta-lyase/cystathionine gamma-synthase
MGIKIHFCDLTDPKSFIPLVNENTRILYLESPANPSLELINTPVLMEALNKINAKRTEPKKILSVFDNTFATPYCQRPAEYGIDLIVHSLTKGLGGFGTVMGGAVISKQEFHERLVLFRKDYGSVLPPLNAWHILVYGVPTLALRIPKQQANALKVAQFLETHSLIGKVHYPGLPSFPQYDLAQQLLRDYDGNFAPGIMIYFALKGSDPEHSKSAGQRMMNYLAENAYAVTLAVSLGQLRTLIEHPASMSHVGYPAAQQIAMGIDPGGIRLAVGIENANDIIADLDAALEHAYKPE